MIFNSKATEIFFKFTFDISGVLCLSTSYYLCTWNYHKENINESILGERMPCNSQGVTHQRNCDNQKESCTHKMRFYRLYSHVRLNKFNAHNFDKNNNFHILLVITSFRWNCKNAYVKLKRIYRLIRINKNVFSFATSFFFFFFFSINDWK